MMNNQIYNNQAQAAQLPGDMTNPINPNQITPTPISPKAFSNQGTINGVYGNANQGMPTRSMPIVPPAGVETSITPDLGIENQ